MGLIDKEEDARELAELDEMNELVTTLSQQGYDRVAMLMDLIEVEAARERLFDEAGGE